MTHNHELIPVPSEHPVPLADQLRLAVAAYLARFQGSSRDHADSDLRCYLTWCAGHGLDPLAATRPHLELSIRWMQEACRFKPSTVSRRFSVTAGFYRTCVIDGILDQSPAEHLQDLIPLGVHGEGSRSRVLPIRVIPQMIHQLACSFCSGHPQGDVLSNQVLAKCAVNETPLRHRRIGVGWSQRRG